MESEPKTDSELKESSSLSSVLYEKLKTGEYEHTLRILKGKEHEHYLKHNSLEIVPIITRVLQEEFCTSDTEECIEKMLEYIAYVANQKEALLVFLEEVEIFRSKKQFRVILKPLQTILLQQVSTSTKSNSFSWVFNTLNAHISVLPLPSENNLEGGERKLLDADPNMQNLIDTLGFISDFYFVFYEKVLAKDLIWPDKTMKSGEYLSFFILQLLHKPLAYLDVYIVEGDYGSTLYQTCSKFVRMVSCLFINPFKLLAYIKPKIGNKNSADSVPQLQNREGEEENELVSQLSLAMYFYCIIGQRMSESNLPCVYASEYLFFSCLPSCIYLLTEKETFAIHKGLILFKALVNNLHDKALPPSCLEVPNHLDILKALVQVMMFCESRECRTLALNCMKHWLWKFESSERFRLFTTILSTVNHAGILGVIIHELKENVRINLSDSKLLDSNFTGVKLQNILSLSCSLPNGERTDLLEWSDKIMGALNLLIFICMCDPQNISNYKAILPKLSREFLEPLENGLRISTGHYELKLKDLNEGKSDKLSHPEVDVNINGGSIPGISIEQEKEMVLHALNWFDIMQSIWARANKLVSEHVIS